MFESNLAHHGHQQCVVIDSDVGLFKHRCTFELVGGYFVVASLDGNSQTICLLFKLFHEFEDTTRDRTKIVVIELLVFGCNVSHQGTAGLHQVRAGKEQSLIHEKILLLPSQRDIDLLDILIEILADIFCGFPYGLQGFEQRCLEVKSFTGICNKNTRNTECFV